MSSIANVCKDEVPLGYIVWTLAAVFAWINVFIVPSMIWGINTELATIALLMGDVGILLALGVSIVSLCIIKGKNGDTHSTNLYQQIKK